MLRTTFMCFGFLLVFSSMVDAACYTCGSTTNIRNQWPNNFDAEFSIPITNSVSGGWTLELEFSKPVRNLQSWRANVKHTNNESTLYILENKSWNPDLSPGQNLAMSFLGQFNGQAPDFKVLLLGQADCGQCSDTDSAVIQTTPRPAVVTPLGCQTCCSTAQITHEWPGNFDGEFTLPIKNEVTGGWMVELVFSEPVSNLQVYDAQITDILNGGKIYRLKNKSYNADLAAGAVHIQRFQASRTVTPSFTAHMVGQPECCQDDPSSCQMSTTAQPLTTELHGNEVTTTASLECPSTSIVDEWPGHFKGEIVIPIRNQVSGGWMVELKFSDPVFNLQVYRGDVVSILNAGKMYMIKNKDYNADQSVGTVLREQFQASASSTPTFTARMIGQPDCSEEMEASTDQTALPTNAPTELPTHLPTVLPTEPGTTPVPVFSRADSKTSTPGQSTTVKPTETMHSTQLTSSGLKFLDINGLY